jgi:hypothetical protein
MHHRHVPVHVCAISILWNFHTNPYQSTVKPQVETTVWVPVKPQERKLHGEFNLNTKKIKLNNALVGYPYLCVSSN